MHRITKVTHHTDHLAGGQTTGRERDEVRYCIKVSWRRSIPQRGGSMPQRDIGDMQGAETFNGCPQQPALDGEGDYRRKVPIDSVRRVPFTQSWCESSRMSFRTDGLCQ